MKTFMRYGAVALWLLGFALLIGLVGYFGVDDILRALSLVGWRIVLVCAVYPLAIWVDTECWRLMLPPEERPSMLALYWPRWIGDAVNFLLPVAQVGGEVVRAMAITRLGVSGIASGASVVADITLGAITEVLFSLVGIVLLARIGGVADAEVLAAVGALALIFFVALFYLAQHAGMFRRTVRMLEHIVPMDSLRQLVGSAQALDEAIMAAYRNRREMLIACAWRMLGWLAGAVEVWLALNFLGHPVGILDAIILESIGQAIRHAAFIVPGGLGVQEGGLMLLSAVVGTGPETGLELSLVKRVRELLLSLPPLLWWYGSEGKAMLQRAMR